MVSSYVDITERKILERRFELAIEAAPNAMMIVDKTGKIILINKQTEILFGYERHELNDLSIDTLIPDKIKAQHPQLFASAARQGKAKSLARSLG